MDFTTEFKVRRARLIGSMRELLDGAEVAGRADLSRREDARFRELEAELDRLDREARVAARNGDGQSWRSLPPVAGSPAARQAAREAAHAAGEGSGFDPRLAQDYASPVMPGRRGLLGAGDSMEEWARGRGLTGSEIDTRDVSLGALVQAHVTGDRRHLSAGELLALQEGGESGVSGILTPHVLSARLIDLARPRSVVFEAGASLLPLESDHTTLARLDDAGDPVWRGEGEEITPTTQTWTPLVAQPKTVATLQKISRELLEDMSQGARQMVEAAIVKGIATALDHVALEGSGSGAEPQGLDGVEGVGALDMAGDGEVPNYDDLVRAAFVCKKANAEPGAFVLATRDAETIGLLKDAEGLPAQPPPAIASVPVLDTTAIRTDRTHGSTGTGTSYGYTGQWSSLVVAVRPSLNIRLLRLEERYAETLEVGLLAFLRADVLVTRPADFCLIRGLKALA